MTGSRTTDRRWTSTTRRGLWSWVALGSISAIAVGAGLGGGPLARASAHAPAASSARSVASADGSLLTATTVPHSSDLWVIGQVLVGTQAGYRFFEARRHHGHWLRVKAPPIGADSGSLNGIAAGSGHAVWLGGAKQVSNTKVSAAIYKWSGKKFVTAKLPELQKAFAGDPGVAAMSASSATNAWAVGDLYLPGGTKHVALHWNGRKWTAVPVPLTGDAAGLRAVATSGPNNAWAVADDEVSTLLHWDGSVWSEVGPPPGHVQLDALAVSSPTLAYAVGYKLLPHSRYGTVILRYNGTTWAPAPVAKGLPDSQVISVSMRGSTAWAIGTLNNSKGSVILHSTGGVWRTQKSTGRLIDLYAVAAGAANRAFAVGQYYNSAFAVKTYVDYYNGHNWKPVPSGF